MQAFWTCGLTVREEVVDRIRVAIVPGRIWNHALKQRTANRIVDAIKLLLRHRKLRRLQILARRLIKSRAVEVSREINEVRIQTTCGVDLWVLVAIEWSFDLDMSTSVNNINLFLRQSLLPPRTYVFVVTSPTRRIDHTPNTAITRRTKWRIQSLEKRIRSRNIPLLVQCHGICLQVTIDIRIQSPNRRAIVEGSIRAIAV